MLLLTVNNWDLKRVEVHPSTVMALWNVNWFGPCLMQIAQSC